MSSISRLSTLIPGQTATIHALHLDPSFKFRLKALGFRTGKLLHLVRIAPLNGPLHLKIGNTEVMLRKKDAENIEVLM